MLDFHMLLFYKPKSNSALVFIFLSPYLMERNLKRKLYLPLLLQSGLALVLTSCTTIQTNDGLQSLNEGNPSQAITQLVSAVEELTPVPRKNSSHTNFSNNLSARDHFAYFFLDFAIQL